MVAHAIGQLFSFTEACTVDKHVDVEHDVQQLLIFGINLTVMHLGPPSVPVGQCRSAIAVMSR